MGHQLWLPLGHPKHTEIILCCNENIANNETKAALGAPGPGQMCLATAFAPVAPTLPYPGLLQEPTLPSELLILGSLLTLPCLLAKGCRERVLD